MERCRACGSTAGLGTREAYALTLALIGTIRTLIEASILPVSVWLDLEVWRIILRAVILRGGGLLVG